MEYTPNYNLKKPGDQDNVLVGDLNENMDTVDATMKKISDGKANLDPDTGKVPDEELPDDLFLKLIGGTMKGAIAMGGSPVSGLVDPVADDHAARKSYVDKTVEEFRTYVDGYFPKGAVLEYTGTGTTTLTLTVPFQPKALLHWNSGTWGGFFFKNGLSQDNTGLTVKFLASSVKLTASSASAARNTKGTVYNCLVFGD